MLIVKRERREGGERKERKKERKGKFKIRE